MLIAAIILTAGTASDSGGVCICRNYETTALCWKVQRQLIKKCHRTISGIHMSRIYACGYQF